MVLSWRLRDLHVNCREANFREVKKYAVHYPHLFRVADVIGNTALHYAAMSLDAEFVAFVLDIYREPKNFATLTVRYETREALLGDGLALRPGGPYSAGDFVVARLSQQGLAATVGVLVGDGLEATSSEFDFSRRDAFVRVQPDPKVEDIVRALENGSWPKCFPLLLRFRRPAHMEILAEDTWTLVEAGVTERKLHPDILRQGTLILRMLSRERQLLAERTAARKPPPTLDLSLLGPASKRKPDSQTQSPLSVGAAPNLPSIFAQSPLQSPQFARSIRPPPDDVSLPSLSKTRSEPALPKLPWARVG
ncbi:unnamed protein product [Symbiodinium natans]|uniref:Uncharacterized protein n=1 Tax=Symbiodinium natans TaxID=878477 RepID=A0A812VH91_9DINO|nr:unnamed protein product [Symbiodinium natans]